MVFTDQVALTAAERYELLILVNDLERLVDASWVLVHHSDSVPEYRPGKHLKDWLESDNLSFVSYQEALKPLSTLRAHFRHSTRKSWKPALLKAIRAALFNPLFSMTGNSNSLTEFADYVKLNKLLEATFLLVRSHEFDQPPSLYGRLEMHLPEPFIWGGLFYAEQGIKDALESLAFVGYYRRWHVEWHAAAGFLLFQRYEKIYNLLHLAHGLAFGTLVLQDDKQHLASIRNALLGRFKATPLGKLCRFLTSCLLDAASFNSHLHNHAAANRKVRIVEEIIHLSANYFIHLKPTNDHEQI